MTRDFDFAKLVQKYQNKTAIVDNGRAYNYGELADKVAAVYKAHQFNAPYVVLIAQSNLTFISQFLAIHKAGCVPVVVNQREAPQLDTLLSAIDWQWLDDCAVSKKKPITRSNLLFLGMTSGTTGTPKFYQRDWLSWQLGFKQCEKAFEMTDYAGVMTTSPMATSLGLHSLLLSLYLGKTFYCYTRQQQQQLTSATLVYTVPIFMTAKYRGWADDAQVKGVVSCGGELTPSLVRDWHRLYPQQALYELYGASETSLIAFQNLMHGKKVNQVGRLFADVELTFTNQHITVASPYLFSGYLGSTQKITFVETDDVGDYQDEQLFVYGRASDVINHGGNKIYPSQLETILQTITTAAVVFGVPDSTYGEKIVAMVVTSKPLDKLKMVMAEQTPAYKRPSQYIFVSEIPKTKQQKISRTQLALRYVAGEWT